MRPVRDVRGRRSRAGTGAGTNLARADNGPSRDIVATSLRKEPGALDGSASSTRSADLWRLGLKFVIIRFEMGTPSSIGVLAQVLVVAGLLVSTSGCGGGGSSATKSTTAEATQTVVAISNLPTHAHFISRLDALCSQSNRLVGDQKALAQAINAQELKKAGAIVASTEPDAVAFYLKFGRLIPSVEDRAAFARYLLLTHRYVGLNERLAAALRAHAVKEVHRIVGFTQKVADQRTNTALDLGWTSCGT
jgi:hypothetical protein